MAKNKITFKKEYGDDFRYSYYFTGSQRQPTLGEIQEFIVNNRLEDEFDAPFIVCAIRAQGIELDDGFENEKNNTVEFCSYNGGKNDSSCPICGHERDMSGDVCPICNKPWES